MKIVPEQEDFFLLVSIPVLCTLVILSVLDESVCVSPPQIAAHENILVKWFFGEIHFFPVTVDDFIFQLPPSQKGCQGCWQKDV